MRDTNLSQGELIPDGTAPGIARVTGRAFEGFGQFSFASGRIAHPVYYAGDHRDPSLLLLPEIAGVSPGLRMFAQRLIGARFRVFVPWLFGPLGVRAPVRNGIRLCISREFANLRGGVSSPVTTWLRALGAHISKHSGGTQIGAIGMCLTGAFAIPLIIDPQVVAASRCTALSAALSAFRGARDRARKAVESTQRLRQRNRGSARATRFR